MWVARAQFGQVRAGRVVIDKAGAGRAAAVEDAVNLAGDVPEGIASDHAGEKGAVWSVEYEEVSG